MTSKNPTTTFCEVSCNYSVSEKLIIMTKNLPNYRGKAKSGMSPKNRRLFSLPELKLAYLLLRFINCFLKSQGNLLESFPRKSVTSTANGDVKSRLILLCKLVYLSLNVSSN